MIELQRAKLLGQSPPPAASPSQNSTHSSRMGSTPQQANNTSTISPVQAAISEIASEDAQMQRFIHRMQRRNDSHPIGDSISGPTVPTALSRRILNKQGVGYLDETVAAVISASADRFLATVLQQGMACRDQRLKGAFLAKEANRHKKRHMQHYTADKDDRKRRKEALEKQIEEKHLNAIAAAEALSKKGDKKKNTKKKTDQQNGVPKKPLNEDDDVASYDSIDEEEEYYQDKQGHSQVRYPKNGNDEEEDDTLKLRDLTRPLEAWGFHVTGKEALEPSLLESENEGDEEEEDAVEKEDSVNQTDDNPNDESILFAGIDLPGSKAESKQGDESDNGKRKGTTSPTPPAAS